MEKESKERYESPDVTDFGTIEEVTKGSIAVSTDDFPIGRDNVGPSPAPDPGGGGGGSAIIA